jgi:type I restriction enzyme S subunit
MPNLNTALLGACPFVVPPPNEQRAIAHILGTLDDKIELNRRMNESLEAVARALFKSWFVDFDPVRAKAEGRDSGLPNHIANLFPDSFEDSELGEIPTGWCFRTLSDVLSVLTDGSHSSPATTEFGLPMASVKDLTPWGVVVSTCRRISPRDFDGLVANGCQPSRGDILLSKDGARCLEIACEYQQEDQIVLLSSVAILRPKKRNWSSYIHTWLTLPSTRIYLREGFVSGSAIPRAVLKDLKRVELLVPSDQAVGAFDDEVEVLRERIRNNVNESATLARARDALLPKLISGEMRVGERTERSIHE